MTQRNTNDRQLHYGVETIEGTEVIGGAANSIETTNLVLSPDWAHHSRTAIQQLGNLRGLVGMQADPFISFSVLCRGGAANSSVVPAIDALLQSVFSPTAADTGGTTIADNVSVLPTLNVVNASNFSIGNAVAVETGDATGLYEVGWVAATDAMASPQTITLEQSLPFPAVLGARVKPSITYRPQNMGHGSLSFQAWTDATTRLSFSGCKGSLKLDLPSEGAPATLTFAFSGIRQEHGTDTRPLVTPDTAMPLASNRLLVGGSVRALRRSSWNLAQRVGRKRAQSATAGTYSQVVTNRTVSGVVQLLDTGDEQFANWGSGAEEIICHQFGSAEFNMMAYRIPKAQRVNVEYGDSRGITTDVATFQAGLTVGEDEIALAFL